MKLEIITYPHPVLKEKCEPVAEITPDIAELASNMLETMYEARGVGLAAPQVGVKLRMIVMDAGYASDAPQPRVIVNPVLELQGEEILSEKEGCLSVPLEYRADVIRNSKVRLRGQDLSGNALDEILEGFPAIIVQHEVDHLDGRLFIDKISHLRRSLYDTRIKKWRKKQGG